MPEPMTDRDYVGQAGSCCPYCRGTSIEGDEINFSGGAMSQEVSCATCGADWFDLYKLEGWEPGRSAGDSGSAEEPPGKDEPDQ